MAPKKKGDEGNPGDRQQFSKLQYDRKEEYRRRMMTAHVEILMKGKEDSEEFQAVGRKTHCCLQWVAARKIHDNSWCEGLVVAQRESAPRPGEVCIFGPYDATWVRLLGGHKVDKTHKPRGNDRGDCLPTRGHN